LATGITVCICTYVVGKTDTPDRNSGFFRYTGLSGILANLFLPGWVVTNGLSVVFICFVALEITAVILLIGNVPDVSTGKAQEHSARFLPGTLCWLRKP
jgi:hypothetical protein